MTSLDWSLEEEVCKNIVELARENTRLSINGLASEGGRFRLEEEVNELKKKLEAAERRIARQEAYTNDLETATRRLQQIMTVVWDTIKNKSKWRGELQQAIIAWDRTLQLRPRYEDNSK
jgi:hypothetical protein